jgi:adenine-specific DNA-methyltransferase
MANINENKFYQALENIFTGANIEGESGYVNLLKIKSNYYTLILEQFKKEVVSQSIITDSFKEEFFDKLYSFFEKYFSESGSVYFVKTANWQRVYEQVYTDNKDVVLFWKTHMLYYVKSDILFQSIEMTLNDEKSKMEYHFFFDV